MGKKEEAASFFTGFLIGGLVGAATALLLAPQSGEETRMQIHDKGIELKDKAGVTYADVQKKVEAATADLRAKVEELSHKVDHAIAQGKETMTKKLGKKGETVADVVAESVGDEPAAGELPVA